MLDVPPARLRSRAASAIHGPTTSTGLATDLEHAATTPAFSFITPNL
jgi:hypothetical protein